MSQVNRKGEKPASSPALEAAIRRRELSESVDRLARRVRVLEERAQALIDLAGDPEQSHRMVTRREIVRTLRGDA